MKKFTLNLPLLIFLLLDVTASVLIFVLTPSEIKTTANFIISWIFAGPIGWLAMYGITVYVQSNKETRILTLAHVTGPCLFFEMCYTVWFFIAGYALRDNAVVATVIAEIVITVIYICVIGSKIFGLSVLREVNADQKRTVEAKKDNFIPELTRMLASAITAAEDAEIKNKLYDLSSQISLSQVRSPAEAEMTERELKALVYQINQFVLLREYEEIEPLIRKATLKLSERNSQCLTYQTR